MQEAIDMALEEAKEQMDKATDRLKMELKKVRAGRAHPSMLESVKIDYYGTMTPISQVANVNNTDARTLVVQPWEKPMLEPISTGIINANLGLNPVNNGEVLIINVPPLPRREGSNFPNAQEVRENRQEYPFAMREKMQTIFLNRQKKRV
jgi:ribosome recycling factor